MAVDGIEWLVFDLGGVLIEVEPGEATLARLAEASGTPPERLQGPLRERFLERPYSLAESFQAGEIAEEPFLDALNMSLKRPLSRAALCRHLQAMLLDDMPDSVALLARLAEHVNTACYSNTNPVHWRHARERFDLFRHFRASLASYEVGIAKPDARVFDHMESLFDVPPSACALIDDRIVNVEAAHMAGWHGIHFRGIDQLRQDLEALGLPVTAK